MSEAGDRKAETRRKVLKVASKAIRAQGPDAVGVAAVMREAGLTHGGFYAHFRSKDELVSEALRDLFGGGEDNFRRIVGPRTGRAALERFVDVYVSRAHRDGPEQGCPMAVMAAEVARQPEPVREAFQDGYRRLIARLAERLPPTAAPSPEALARSLLAEMAGAVALSRATPDREESDRILATSRAAVKARLPHTEDWTPA